MTYKFAPQEWERFALCKDRPDVDFFPENSTGVRLAQKVCAICPARKACLDHALKHHIDHGIWGGKSERARRALRKSYVALEMPTTRERLNARFDELVDTQFAAAKADTIELRRELA